jgi:hypothetical protein
MAGQNAHMMPDGECKIAGAKSSSDAVVDDRRPENDIVIEKSVGVGGANKPDDVFNIQYGLDQVPPIDGGPATPLKIDGLSGPKTIAAIREFQKKYFGMAGCDGRIDPGKKTLAKLNEKRQRWIQPYLPLSLVVDGWLLANMLRHVPYTRACVHAAMTKISSAQVGGLFGDSSMALINKHFRLNNGDDQASALAKMYNLYSFMLSVLDRPDAYCTLDTTDEGEGISSVAFARLGGFFDKSDLTGKIKFRRGAYFASEIQDFAAFVFIHEMRHYVEQLGDVGHHAKGWVTDPGMQALNTKQLLGNCDTYAGFALEARNGEMQRPGWVKSTQFR